MIKRESITAKIERYECCLCGEIYLGFGNNPYPLSSKGRCCDLCNFKKVIPVRLNNEL